MAAIRLVQGWSPIKRRAYSDERVTDSVLKPSTCLFRRETHLEDGHWFCKPLEIV